MCRALQPCRDTEAAGMRIEVESIARRKGWMGWGTGRVGGAGIPLIGREPVRFYHVAPARAMEGRGGAAKARAGRTCRPSAMFFPHHLTHSAMKAKGANSCRQASPVSPTTCRLSFYSQSLSEPCHIQDAQTFTKTEESVSFVALQI